MSDQDNQSALASQLQQGNDQPAPSAMNGDGMTVNLPTGERIELGETNAQTKPYVPKRT